MTFLIWLDDVRPIDKRYDPYVRHGNYADPKSVNAAIYWIKEAEKGDIKTLFLTSTMTLVILPMMAAMA